MQAVNQAHFNVANGDTLLGQQPDYAAGYFYNWAISNLRQYIALVNQAQVEGRVTQTAAEVLVSEANTIIREIEQNL